MGLRGHRKFIGRTVLLGHTRRGGGRAATERMWVRLLKDFLRSYETCETRGIGKREPGFIVKQRMELA